MELNLRHWKKIGGLVCLIGNCVGEIRRELGKLVDFVGRSRLEQLF